VRGDNFAAGFHIGEWQASRCFRAVQGNDERELPGVLPALLARRVRLLDKATLRNQLTSLELVPPFFWRAFFLCAEHDRQPGGESPLLMVECTVQLFLLGLRSRMFGVLN
jgi:hypothetical protein